MLSSYRESIAVLYVMEGYLHISQSGDQVIVRADTLSRGFCCDACWMVVCGPFSADPCNIMIDGAGALPPLKSGRFQTWICRRRVMGRSCGKWE